MGSTRRNRRQRRKKTPKNQSVLTGNGTELVVEAPSTPIFQASSSTVESSHPTNVQENSRLKVDLQIKSFNARAEKTRRLIVKNENLDAQERQQELKALSTTIDAVRAVERDPTMIVCLLGKLCRKLDQLHIKHAFLAQGQEPAANIRLPGGKTSWELSVSQSDVCNAVGLYLGHAHDEQAQAASSASENRNAHHASSPAIEAYLQPDRQSSQPLDPHDTSAKEFHGQSLSSSHIASHAPLATTSDVGQVDRREIAPTDGNLHLERPKDGETPATLESATGRDPIEGAATKAIPRISKQHVYRSVVGETQAHATKHYSTVPVPNIESSHTPLSPRNNHDPTVFLVHEAGPPTTDHAGSRRRLIDGKSLLDPSEVIEDDEFAAKASHKVAAHTSPPSDVFTLSAEQSTRFTQIISATSSHFNEFVEAMAEIGLDVGEPARRISWKLNQLRQDGPSAARRFFSAAVVSQSPSTEPTIISDVDREITSPSNGPVQWPKASYQGHGTVLSGQREAGRKTNAQVELETREELNDNQISDISIPITGSLIDTTKDRWHAVEDSGTNDSEPGAVIVPWKLWSREQKQQKMEEGYVDPNYLESADTVFTHDESVVKLEKNDRSNTATRLPKAAPLENGSRVTRSSSESSSSKSPAKIEISAESSFSNSTAASDPVSTLDPPRTAHPARLKTIRRTLGMQFAKPIQVREEPYEVRFPGSSRSTGRSLSEDRSCLYGKAARHTPKIETQFPELHDGVPGPSSTGNRSQIRPSRLPTLQPESSEKDEIYIDEFISQLQEIKKSNGSWVKPELLAQLLHLP